MTGIKKVQVIFLPHFAQNVAPGRTGLPQAGHTEVGEAGTAGTGAVTGAPQALQNFLPGVTGLPQFPHICWAAGTGVIVVFGDGSSACTLLIIGTPGPTPPERVTEIRFPALSYV